METTILTTQKLAIGHADGNKQVLHENLDLSLNKAQVVCLLGPNGAGKSTLMRTLCGLLKPKSGTICIEGRSIANMKQADLAHRVSIVLTERDKPDFLTVFELAALGRMPHTNFFGKLSADDKEKINTALNQTGIAHKYNSPLNKLSDGERQKAMIARALAQETPIILLDEPTAFLDLPGKIDIFKLLKQIARTQQKAVLISTHDLDLALRFSDQVWLMSKDKKLQCLDQETAKNLELIYEYFGLDKSMFTFESQNFTITPLL